MAQALVQTVQGNGGGYVNSYTFNITPGSGNMLSIQFGCGSTDLPVVTDNNGGTWVADKTQILTAQRQAVVFRAYNHASGATTVTITFEPSKFADSAYICQEWSGSATSAALDQTVGANTAGTGTTYASGSTGTTAQANELLIGAIAADSNAPGYTGDASWTNLLTQAGFDSFTSCATQYRVVSAVGTYSWTLTNGIALQASQAVATYKDASAGSAAVAYVPKMLLMSVG